MHADHITGTGWLKQLLPNVKSVISANSGAKADIHLNDGDTIEFGRHKLKAFSTPGHTNGCMNFINFEQVRYAFIILVKKKFFFVGKRKYVLFCVRKVCVVCCLLRDEKVETECLCGKYFNSQTRTRKKTQFHNLCLYIVFFFFLGRGGEEFIFLITFMGT